MRLSRRIVLLILLCLLPMVVAALLTIGGLYEQRQAQIRAVGEQQLDVAKADIENILSDARALLLALGPVAEMQSCPDRLAGLHQILTGYAFLAVLDNDSRVVCASSPYARELLSSRPAWLTSLLSGTGFRVGEFVAGLNIDRAMLPLALGPNPELGGHVSIAALDLGWLGSHLATIKGIGLSSLANSSLGLLDANGTILARTPHLSQLTGSRASPEVLRLLKASARGMASVKGPDHRTRIVWYDWLKVGTAGVFVTVGVYPPDLMNDLHTAILLALAVAALAAIAAVASTLALGRRFIQAPTEALLVAARQWRQGDLAARADMHGDQSEFGHLGGAFNEMAAALQQREAEQARHAQLLEERVAERTRDLSESNNRLQVEMAEHRRTAVILQQAQKLQAVGRLAGGVAHDFNNLLATILGNLELIERRIGSGDDKIGPLLSRATDAVQRGALLTSRLLAFSRRQRLAARHTDINQLIQDLVTLASSTVGRRVRIETRLASDVWAVFVDPSQVESAILNLTFNARDAMPQGGTLTIATRNRAVSQGEMDLEPGDFVEVSVADTGVGMSPEVLGRAFEPFFTTKELGQNSGLGLSQVYGVARQSGGSVAIRSAAGQGTTVSLFLPRAPEAGGIGPATSQDPVRTRARSEIVLLVDDDADVRQVSVEMLRDLGYEVLEAGNGEEALSLIAGLTVPPALLVLDYAMPGMNGLCLAATLRSMGIQSPFLLATGYAELSDDGSGVVPDAILHKPFSLAELDRTLARLAQRAEVYAR